MTTAANDSDRWARLINGAYQVMECPWRTDCEQYEAAMALLDQVRQDFPEDHDGDIPGSAVRSLADTLHAAMILVPPETLSGAQRESDGIRVTIPKAPY